MTASVEDAELLREAVRDAFTSLSTSADVRAAMATAVGYEPATWRRLAGELGLPGMAIDTELGGGGFSVAELAIAFEEAGATLLCSPLFATAGLAVPLLQAIGDADALAKYASAIAGGELTATVALAEDDGRRDVASVTCTATQSDAGWMLDGVKNYVVDGASAGLVLVVAHAGAELGVFAVDGDATGLAREQLVTLDQTRKQARLVLTSVPAVRLGSGDAVATIAHATAVSRTLLAAEQAGGAQRCLDMTVEYAKTRIQFGRAIGSFQAIKQKLAECLVQVESARSAAYAAAEAAATGDPEFEHIAAIAALTCGHAYSWVTAQTIQLHGGIGFTWEHDAHLYFKRARSSASLLGSSGQLVKLIAGELDATAH
ncbi:MAG TPA: acyl-CoA dehydrogenase family protein [Jatrophihabitans sp.]|jgi:acyl-CoA dehydrogenase